MTVKSDLETIQKYLETGNEDQLDIAILGLRTVATMLRKNSDYGSTVFSRAVLAPEIEPETGIRLRLSDKLDRLLSLLKPGKEAEVKTESVADTCIDSSAYFMLLAIQLLRQLGQIEELRSSFQQVVEPADSTNDKHKTLEMKAHVLQEKLLNSRSLCPLEILLTFCEQLHQLAKEVSQCEPMDTIPRGDELIRQFSDNYGVTLIPAIKFPMGQVAPRATPKETVSTSNRVCPSCGDPCLLSDVTCCNCGYTL